MCATQSVVFIVRKLTTMCLLSIMTNTVTDQALKFHLMMVRETLPQCKGFFFHKSMAEDFIARVDAHALLDSLPCICKCILIPIC